MSIFDAMNISEGAMNVHRFRTEVASRNVANVYTPGYQRQEVEVEASNFTNAVESSSSSTRDFSGGRVDAESGAVRVASVHTVSTGPYDERQQALLATTDLMRAKSAYELNVRATSLLKSMALSSLEIGRGS